MSIPLDRLYDFLEDQVNENDIVIYRWAPHGSKKLEDLQPLRGYALNWASLTTMIPLIMHDQEPVDYNYLESYARITQIQDSSLEFNSHPKIKELIDKVGVLRNYVFRLNIHDRFLLCHSELNSLDIERYKDWFIGVYYWSHALIARDWFRYAQHDRCLTHTPEDYKFDFLVYNRAWSGTREYRLKFAEHLVTHQLASHCLTTFAANDNDLHYTKHEFSNQTLAVQRHDLELHLLPNQHKSTASADYNSVDYNQCGIEVVLETLFDSSKNHLTEKTLRAIACRKPFLLASTPGSLQYLKKYGFKTFAPWIDESYDTVADPAQRLEAVVLEMKRLQQLPREQKLEMWHQLNKIADYNHKLFFDPWWQQGIVEEFKQNLRQALDQLQQHKTGQWFLAMREIVKEIPEFRDSLHKDLPYRSLQDLELVLSKIKS